MLIWNFFARIARAILPASAIKSLRGDFKSVSGRLMARRERINLLFYGLCGGSYIDWYARRMDRFAANPVVDPVTKRQYHDSGIDDLETLKQLGLERNQMLHEFGCGFLRSAHYFAQYLDKGNFSANDASGERIRAGIEYLKSTYGFNISEKQPDLIVNADNSFDWLHRYPKIFWCHAVFTHMPEADIEDVFCNLPRVMKRDGAFYFTYSEKKNQHYDVERMGPKDWWHRHKFFASLANRHGLKIEDLTGFIQSRGCYRPEHGFARLTIAQ